ncbi:hypothetical protein CHS0354_000552 [Potamilus streckersoni]|uniref:Replicative DNA helicase n=1 Tax=Potamilus streckersoni TaxID=2493646 RepID=A0AAE0W8D9_9BIVA|nr:hypothetical protein CHS0354_000552 [Potamilus streckersoni]
MNTSNSSAPEEVDISAWTSLEDIYASAKKCLKCSLGHSRKNVVFGSGSGKCGLVIIGEAPGADEDEKGLPFVGKSGKLLTELLQLIHFTRDEVYIANVIKCRPPQNRRPEREEIASCFPYLKRQMELIKPKGSTNGYDKQGRKLPSSKEMEQNVLASILINGESIEKAILVFAEDRDKVFYYSSHQNIFSSMYSLYSKKDPIDVETVAVELEKRNLLANVGGVYELASLSNKVATSANVEYYARIVKEKFLYRKMINLCAEVSGTAYEEKKDVFELIEQASKNIFEISQSSVRKRASLVRELLKHSIEKILDLQNRKSSVIGISSGFVGIDQLTAGFQDSDLIIVAARPSTGKTALALAFARNAAVENRKSVLFFSLEMNEQQLAMRLLCAEARADAQKVRTGKVTNDEVNRIINKIDALAESELFIDDTPSISIIELMAKARRMKQEKNISMIVVDYLQLVSPVRDMKANREQEIAQISRSLKALAKELNIPVIALAQLNRSIDQRGTSEKRPQLSDLRESGSIEQDSDVVIFLSRPETYGITEFPDGSSTKDVIEVIIGKQRNGPIGDVKLKFIKQYGRFESLTTIYSASDLQSPYETERANLSAKKVEDDMISDAEKNFDASDAPF